MGRTRKKGEAGAPVVIKKYANRRLYNTETSSYITLDNLAAMVREGREFAVQDAKSGDDITHSVLTQIIVDSESRGQTMLPAGFLRQIISLYGDAMQPSVPHYLEAAMQSFRANQGQFRQMVDKALEVSPFGEMAKQQLHLIEGAFRGLVPGTAASGAAEPAKQKPADKDDLASLKAEMAALKAKLDRLDN
jgi:polyhydroxyalkanoate synthesis repressor PhaR